MPRVKRLLGNALTLVAAIAAAATVARGGHESPVYPSYYPHEIAIEAMTPDRAAGLLRDNKIQAYLGSEPEFSGEVPASIRSIEVLGSFVIVRSNPESPAAKTKAAECAAVEAVAHDLAGKSGFVFHPYPVTPFHGDYLYHVDRAEAAQLRFRDLSAEAVKVRPRVKVDGALASLVPLERRSPGPDWDVAVEESDAAKLVASSTTAINGWLGPSWVKTGWFHAYRLLAATIDDAVTRSRIDTAMERLETGDFRDAIERVNLERELVASLTGTCREIVVGYTVKRRYFSAEFTNGIENVGFDSIAGLDSPMFIRTVKLKDFPWNGWLVLGIDGRPGSAWNPIAGFYDDFGRLLWSAVGDPALLPAPYDAGWMLNRIADVTSSAGR